MLNRYYRKKFDKEKMLQDTSILTRTEEGAADSSITFYEVMPGIELTYNFFHEKIIYGSLCLGYLHPFFWVMHCVIFGGIYSIWFGATCILIFTTNHSRRGGFGCPMLYLEAEKKCKTT